VREKARMPMQGRACESECESDREGERKRQEERKRDQKQRKKIGSLKPSRNSTACYLVKQKEKILNKERK